MSYWQRETWTISWTHGTSCLKALKIVWIVGVPSKDEMKSFVIVNVTMCGDGHKNDTNKIQIYWEYTKNSMPIYEYKCDVCTNVEEQIQRHDVDEIECPVCNNTAKRIISLSSFELKGGGWYKDGYGIKKPESKPSPPKTSDGVTKAKPLKDE